jgi:polyhydroxyalkanoate synthesis regulator phasin
MLLSDLRKTFEAAIGNLTPAKAQELAKSMLEPGAAKEQVAKTASDLMDWSQHNRDRMRGFVDREVQSQMKTVGVASQSELDALKKRVRELERAAGLTASGRKKPAARKPAARKKTTAKPPAAPAAPAAPTPPASMPPAATDAS